MRAATVDTTGYESAARDAARTEGTVIVVSSAELVECTCPEWCDRDHDRD